MSQPASHPRHNSVPPRPGEVAYTDAQGNAVARADGDPSTSSSCPAPPTIETEMAAINDVLSEVGADQQCKQIFDSDTSTDFVKVDAAVGISTPFGGAGAAVATTNASTDLSSSLSSAGCTDLFVNAQQQINSTQNIMCTLNENSTTSNVSMGSNATITIRKKTHTGAEYIAQMAYRTAAITALTAQMPTAPYMLPWYADLSDTGQRVASEAYQAAGNAIARRSAVINGQTRITNSTFNVSAGLNMKVVNDLTTQAATKIANEVKKAAASEAMNQIKKKTGYGAQTPNIKSIVDTKIENATQNINTDITRTVSDIKADGSSNAEFRIEYYGPMIIDNLEVTVDAQAKLITDNIMKSSKDIGSQVAMEVLSDAAAGNSADTTSAGQDAVLDTIMKGNVAMSEANAEGVANALSTFTGGGGMMGIIILVVIGIAIFMFAPKIIGVVFPMAGPGGGAMKYVMQFVIFLIAYIIVAYFFGFWPFNTSENKLMQRLDYSKRVFPPLRGEFSRRRNHDRDRGIYGM